MEILDGIQKHNWFSGREGPVSFPSSCWGGEGPHILKKGPFDTYIYIYIFPMRFWWDVQLLRGSDLGVVLKGDKAPLRFSLFVWFAQFSLANCDSRDLSQTSHFEFPCLFRVLNSQLGCST